MGVNTDQYALIELALTKGRMLARAIGRDDMPMTLREALTFRKAQMRPERYHVMPWDCELVKAAFTSKVNDKPFSPAWLSVSC